MIASVSRRAHKVRLNSDFRLDIKWWLDFAATFNGRARIIPSAEPAVAVYSDASLSGFGATHGNDWLAGTFTGSRTNYAKWLGHHYAGSQDGGCVTTNINVLEMWPVLKAVERWGHLWTDRTVVMVTDNTQVKAALNTGRSVNGTTMGWLREIFWSSITNNFEIQAVYINTLDNVVCDSLSRLDSYKNIARIRAVDEGKLMCCHVIFVC